MPRNNRHEKRNKRRHNHWALAQHVPKAVVFVWQAARRCQ